MKQGWYSIAEFARKKVGITYNKFLNNPVATFPFRHLKNELIDKKTTWSSLNVANPSSPIGKLDFFCQFS
jgi:hypothetical protein